MDNKIKRGHIDLVLKAWLQTDGTAQRVGACYTYPQMGGYHAHASGCDPKNFGEDKGGRPSAWKGENPASGTRVASDPKHRGKYLIQWRGNVLAHRVWLDCPSDKELVEPRWKWKSIREPTASEPPRGSIHNKIKQEVKEEKKRRRRLNLGPSDQKERSGSSRCARRTGCGLTKRRRLLW